MLAHRPRQRTTRGRSLSIVLFVAAMGAPAAAPAQTQWWQGELDAPMQGRIDFVVAFTPGAEPGTYTAVIDIPVQGVRGLPLVDVVLSDAEIRFTLQPAGAVFEATRAPDGKTAEGTLKQSGLTIPIRMRQVTEDQARAVGPPRPQTPKPPFPYTQREVHYENPVDGTKLAGTLTLPEGDGPHPAVLLITGSGAQDRDETIFGHKPFHVIADHLTRQGVAVLRVDDRGVGGSTGSTSDSTSKDFANDVLAGIKFLKSQPEIDADRLGLIGHSEGGLIAPLAATRSRSVRCIVLLAGPGLPGHEVLTLQKEAAMRLGGVGAEEIKRRMEAHRALVKAVLDNADADAVRKAAAALVIMELEPVVASGAMTPEQVEAYIDATVTTMTCAWMRSFLAYDPRETLRKLDRPVLALYGSLDFQVSADENIAALTGALREAGNDDVTVRKLDGLNHLFQEATTGMLAEYATIQQTIAPQVLDEIAAWLRKRLDLK